MLKEKEMKTLYRIFIIFPYKVAVNLKNDAVIYITFFVFFFFLNKILFVWKFQKILLLRA